MTHNIDDIVFLKGNPNDNTWYEAQVLCVHGDYCWVVKRRVSTHYKSFVDSREIRGSTWHYRWSPETYEAKKCLKDLPTSVKTKMGI